MNMVTVSTAQLRALCNLQCHTLVILEASWLLGRQDYTQQLLSKLDLSFNIYRLVVNGSDDAENFAVDELQVRDLPSFAVFGSNGRLKYLSTVQELLFQGISTIRDILSETISAGNINTLYRSLECSPISEILCTMDVVVRPSYVFISGDRASVGKSSICLTVLGSLINMGVSPDSLAYIKPVTQCEAEQLVSKYCARVGSFQISYKFAEYMT